MLLLLQLGTSPPSKWVPGHELRNIVLPLQETPTRSGILSITRRISSTPLPTQPANANKLIQANGCFGCYNITDNFIPHTTKSKRLQ